ncbi:hypothetical protein [Paraburkholderia saeva]|uniref:WD40 repeat domain-containing protein n=1 Tax=Paraburkholderia saeva TaxID=2777537 RepID=A0A9N8X078_9BURK|nr:hypothetical protein [Paraburkholderia saeva]CAG4886946.1 hypothetical protein R70241_00295 [Paraburkholderia saeva]CAG4887044.1 hypothetical protein LMG31841_00323 [Paraburkholderia saeva]
MKLSTAFAATLLTASSAFSAPPAQPPHNPYLADSNYSIGHANSAQTDSTVDAGPVGPTRQLGDDEMRYQDLGMFNLAYLISGPDKNGKRVVWTSGSQFLAKLDYDTFDLVATLRLPGNDHADALTHEQFIKALDSKSSFDQKWAIARKSGYPSLSSVYTLLDKDNEYVAAGKGFVRIYGDATPGDHLSGIVVKAQWNQPANVTGESIGMNMTFDGHIVLATADGYVVVLSRDFSDVQIIRLPGAEEEIPKQPKGVAWIRNSFAVDEKGGIYIASQQHLHKVVWTGSRLSTSEQDGAWNEPFRNSLGRGTGSTPTLVGFGSDPDKLVVITDGDKLMNVTAYWRDEIPADWKQLPDAPSRRIAGLRPANFGNPKLAAAQSEQSVVSTGYGMLVVNNEPRNVPAPIQADRLSKNMFIGYLAYLKEYLPHGVQKFEWDPKTRTLNPAWVNNDVSDINGVPFVSTGSGLVYMSGARNDQWTLEGIDWATGQSKFHYVLGGARFNSFYSQPVIDGNGRVMLSGLYGPLRIQPKQ